MRRVLCPLNVREMRITATCLEEMPGAYVPEYPFIPISYGFKLAREPWELQEFWKLRERTFCGEQKIFTGSDRDEHDANMIPIIAVACEMGTPDRVVGVVRIDEREPGLWWGSRLAVDPDFRRVRNVGYGPFPNDQPRFNGLGALGAGLIYKAVSTANRLGCQTFLATVQEQNARFFSRLHWRTLDRIDLHGRSHYIMRAELEYYPPCKEVF
jgi:hypothetical protein